MNTLHEDLIQDPEFQRLLSIETLVAEAAEVIAKLMDEQNVTKAELARRLNKSRSWVTQMLSGSSNFTIRTLAEVMYALGAEVKLQAQLPGWIAPQKTTGAGWHHTDWTIAIGRVDKAGVWEDLSPQTPEKIGENPASVAVHEDGFRCEYAA